ncbi:histidine phosphatase family protein [Mucilaginibacter sp. PPCGB 2223]|uniref:histidine phosphatase family protein n=1 Tax=Mucilaginibacter sp. PPCGB 2223 TaxID=1886027 RepID=UPI00082482B2|nr:histidine phosphatase family protein [Mucilaginibacter sp. PPCGB 2223]OCX50998.1 histidine phosphatase family protein [Mucilaginibacter sp. PPCGB 2223]
MKKALLYVLCLVVCFITAHTTFAQSENLKLVFIRHAEKPLKGSNLTCQGLNRSLQLPAVLVKKFGVPDYLMVPQLGLGDTTKHSRMFQTIAPLAIQYNLAIATTHKEKDFDQIAADLKAHKGTIIITWEHKAIPGIVKALGIAETLNWPDDDYDSIWIVTFKNGLPQLIKDKEGLHPSANCPI